MHPTLCERWVLTERCCARTQSWGGASKMRMGLSKRAASGEAGEPNEDMASLMGGSGGGGGYPSPRSSGTMEQRSHSLNRQGVPAHASAYPSETQLQQVRFLGVHMVLSCPLRCAA